MNSNNGHHSAYTRYPVVAGMFYPAEPRVLREKILSFLAAARSSVNLPTPKAIIAPHAGYDYSGPIAGSAYACLQKAKHKITRVVILAPAHRYPFSGIALTMAGSYLTPLGAVKIDIAAVTALRDARFTGVQVLEQAYDEEHALEVQLPFLQVVLGDMCNDGKITTDFSIVPLVLGDAATEEVAVVLEKLWGGEETLVVVSSDLSHYEPYTDVHRIDAATAKIILALDYHHLEHEMACGAIPIRGLLSLARSKKLRAVQVDLRSSGDTAGDKGRVVGYGAFHFIEQNEGI